MTNENQTYFEDVELEDDEEEEEEEEVEEEEEEEEYVAPDEFQLIYITP